ncbi:MAG: T9SS type A sorting domain-containing protein [Candidatus Kryptoniota bacterium]
MKKLLPIIVLICILAGGNSLQAQWVQTSGISGQNISCFTASSGELYAGTLGSGIFYSYNNGATWTPLSPQPTNENVHALAISGGALFAGTTTGVYKLSSGGWVAVNTGFRDTTVNTLLTQGNGLLAGTSGGGVYVSTDEGTTWSTMNSGLGNFYVTSLVVTSNPHNFSGIEIYAATYDGLYYTTSLPGSWTLIRPVLIDMSSFAALGQNLFGGTLFSGISLSTDDGATWTTMNSGLPNLNVQCLATSGGNLFAGTTGGVFVLMNNADANQWVPQNSGLTNLNISSLFVSSGVLLAGTTTGVWTYQLSIFPQLTSVEDVPFDQGGFVNLIWKASSLDTNTIYFSSYSIWRAIPQNSSQNLVAFRPISIVERPSTAKSIRNITTAEGTFAFQWIANEQAHRLSTYSYDAPTLYDSMAGTNGIEYFMVSAETYNENIFYDSNIDSGYSVDNLAPVAPVGVAAVFSAGNVVLHWMPNVEPDLKNYQVYRSDSTISTPKLMTPYATTMDTLFNDANPLSGKTAYYVICAQDIHGNLSSPSNEVAFTPTGVHNQQGNTPTIFDLNQNYPNPFNPSTTINYQLPATRFVTLKVYDVLGREVATLVNEKENAGSYAVKFDGSRLASGVYFYQLQAENFSQTKKLILLK